MFITFLCYLGMDTIQAQWYSLLCLCLVHKAMSAFMFFSIFFPLIFEEAFSLDVKSAGNFSFGVTNIVHLVVCLIMQILSNLYKDIDFGWGLSLFICVHFIDSSMFKYNWDPCFCKMTNIYFVCLICLCVPSDCKVQEFSREKKRAILILKIFGQEITAKKRFKIKDMRKCSWNFCW